MSEGISGPELDCGGALGKSGSGDRTFGRGVVPFGLCRPGDRFVFAGVDGKPPTPLRTSGVPLIAPKSVMFLLLYRVHRLGEAVRWKVGQVCRWSAAFFERRDSKTNICLKRTRRVATRMRAALAV